MTLDLGALSRVLSPEKVAAIRAVPCFRDSGYRGLDIGGTLDYYARRYVAQISKFTEIDERGVIADIGAGFGWLAIAFALLTPARVIAVDADDARLAAARAIADIVGVADRIEWRAGRLGKLPLADREARIGYCIEVIEHIGRDEAALRDLARISGEYLVLTTPNRLFPIIAHDTELPFCHWLPLRWRRGYARLFGRTRCENDNLFWSATDLARCLPEFEVVSGFMQYRSLDDFLATFPIYLPYRGGHDAAGPSRARLGYYRLAARLGRRSQYVLPNLAAVYRRRDAR
ncbi:MAG TPA: methyltransferase domain-containing protein [Stellaceae bacterium]|nr:methyltransferase domain-containing protein [Stellaceae bacterium]